MCEFSRKFWKSQVDMYGVLRAYDHVLSATFHKMKSTFSDLVKKPVAPDLCVNPTRGPTDNTAFVDGFGGKHLIQPMVGMGSTGNKHGTKIAPVWLRFRQGGTVKSRFPYAPFSVMGHLHLERGAMAPAL
jgi:hypothetical protein